MELVKQLTEIIQKNQRQKVKTIKLILSITALFLFLSNRSICDAVHGDNVDLWWDLKFKIYSLIFFTLALIGFLESKMFLKVITTQIVIFTAADVIDRWLFNITNFVDSDYALIFFSVVIFLKQSVKCLKRGSII